MEVDEVQCKFPRLDSVTTGNKQNMNDDGDAGGGSVDLTAGAGKFHGWPSSRIVRVSRASGGKDRHSKVLTTKGLRDRRVRLSVNTAIQFYDLQDRLGYDQPSKAVEWLLKAAATSIIELPPMNMTFPDTPKQASDEKRSSTQLGFDSVDLSTHQQMTKSAACSSNSEANKSSGLSLSRSDSRVQERVADKNEKENEPLNPISQTTSFTELLNGRAGSNGTNNSNSTSPNGRGGGESQKSPPRQWSSVSMDYFGGFFGVPPVVTRPAANPLPSVSWDHHHPEVQQLSIVPEHLIIPVVNAAARGNNNGSSEYSLNFKISSGSSSGPSGFPRGTLQSNSSPSYLIPHLQRFPPTNGSSPPSFYIGTVENHHQFCYDDHADDNNMHSGQKRKGKN